MSSDDVVIRVSGLCKRYEIYDSPRDRLKQMMLPRLRRSLGLAGRQYFQEFWALRDVAFEVRRGETVGIVGRNGSGKSTLLQLICGTLSPTAGTVETRGRIAALLELGSGFNPEFSGRENVYMNAAVLGLSRGEVEQRFDRIAAFADIGSFMEQPVKTYSSGMYVRLAFAVIAHVDADILIVDEALSVGDAIFTQKCMRFIRAFQERGSLLFVSHDMGAVQNLCRSSIWLGQGQVKMAGPSKEVTQAYLQDTLQEVYGERAQLTPTAEAVRERKPAPAHDYGARYRVTENLEQSEGWRSGAADILSIRLEKLGADDATHFVGGERVRILIRARANQDLERPILGFLVKDRLGQDLFGENTLPFTAARPLCASRGQEFEAEFVFRLPMLPNGEYALMASVADGDLYDNVQHHYLHQALIIQVVSSRIRWGLVGIPFEDVNLKVCCHEQENP